jgi:hypothetical protein
MGNKPSRVRQRELQQVLNAARKARARHVEFHIGETKVVVPLGENDPIGDNSPVDKHANNVAPQEEISL